MSTYYITPAVTQILLGGQGQSVSIVNNGPSTVYLDDITSVSPLNGMPLPPTAQMTWNKDTPLWAVCNTGGSAILAVNDSAGIVANNRAKFWQHLGSSTGGYTRIFTGLETGHCDTLLLKFTVSPSASTSLLQLFSIFLKWQDAVGGNVLNFDRIQVANLIQTANSYLFVQIPVIGSYVDINILQEDAGIGTVLAVEAFGTNRNLGLAWYSTSLTNTPVVAPTGDPVLAHSPTQTLNAYGGDSFSFKNIPQANLVERIYFASMGQKLTIEYVAQSVTTAGQMDLILVNSTVVARQTFSVAAGAQTGNVSINAPQKQALFVQQSGGLVCASMDMVVTWSN